MKCGVWRKLNAKRLANIDPEEKKKLERDGKRKRCKSKKEISSPKFNIWIEKVLLWKKQIKELKEKNFWKKKYGAKTINLESFNLFDFIRAGQDYMDEKAKYKCDICLIIFTTKKTFRYHNNSTHPCDCHEK